MTTTLRSARRAPRLGNALLALVLLLLAVDPASARSKKKRKEVPATWRGMFLAEHAFTDGIEAGSETQRTDDLFTTLQAGVASDGRWSTGLPLQVALSGRARFFNTAHRYDYVEVRPELGYRIGHSDLVAEYQLTPRRLLFAPEEDGATKAVYEEHVVGLGLRHKFGRSKRLRARLGGEFEHRDFVEGFDARTSDSKIVATSLRYAARPWFTPRLDVELSQREAHDTNYDREEVEIGLGCDLLLPYDLGARFMASQSWRNYTVKMASGPNGSNDNFGREDLVREFELWLFAPLPWLDDVLLQARYKYRTDDSSRDGRSFSFNEVGLALVYTPTGDLPW